MITIRVEKLKESLDDNELGQMEPDWNLLKKAGFRSKVMGKKVWNTIVNTKRSTGQELMMLYYGKLFRKYKKVITAGDPDATYFDWRNEKDLITAFIELNEDAGADKYADNAYERLKYAIYTMRVGDALAGQRSYEKTKQQVEDKFVEEFQKQNKSRISLSQIKKFFSNFWEENINLSMQEAALNHFIRVTLDDHEYPERSIGLESTTAEEDG